MSLYGPHFMLLLSIYVLYSNVTYISSIMSCGNKILSNCFKLFKILEFFPARLDTLPYGLDSNVTQLLTNLLPKPSVFYYLPIVSCNLVSIKLLVLSLLLLLLLKYQLFGITLSF